MPPAGSRAIAVRRHANAPQKYRKYLAPAEADERGLDAGQHDRGAGKAATSRTSIQLAGLRD